MTRSPVVGACAAAGALALTVLVGVAPGHAADIPVPVEGQALSRGTIKTDAPEAVLTVHGVRRVDQGTVVYFSAGFPAATKDASALNLSLALNDQYQKFSSAGRSSFKDDLNAAVAVIDQADSKAYVPLLTPERRCVCSSGSISAHASGVAGEAYAFYVVVPPLPAQVQRVDVVIGDKLIPAVPVQDGALTPTADPAKPVLVGQAWPAVDQAALATVTDPAKSVFPLTLQISDLAGEVTTRTRTAETSVDLASDVLFASDSATLSPKASGVLAKAVAQLKAGGAKGVVKVIGYTDSTNTDAYNKSLSQRRASAVAAALRGLVPAGITLAPEGRGEANPVASNETDAGRALNRRVALSFVPAGS